MLILLPWLEAWGFPRTRPEHIYRGLELLVPRRSGSSAYDIPLLNGAAPGLIVGYLILAAACLFFPATIVAVVSSFAGFAVTIALVLAVNSGEPDDRGASWTYSPFVAIAIWLVTAMVSVVGWSAPRRNS
ncbi:hypothetical protein ACXJJ3_32380 [Kribbella sp. WER1]